MNEKKKPISKYMPFYPSFRKAIDSLHDDKKRLEAYDALTDLGLYEIKSSSTYERDLLLFLLTFITARRNNE